MSHMYQALDHAMYLASELFDETIREGQTKSNAQIHREFVASVFRSIIGDKALVSVGGDEKQDDSVSV